MTRQPDVRLVVGTGLQRRDRLHGAWWPHSDDAATELGPMLAAALARFPVVRGVTLNRDEWPNAPLTLQPLARNSPKVNWYGTIEPHSAVLHCGRDSRIALLVVPPATAEDVALAAMMMTAQHGNCATATDTLIAAQQQCDSRRALQDDAVD